MHNMSDRALKERVIGAVVLVLFAVLVVPIFLDGPQPETPMVSETVALPGQNNQQRTQQTIILDRDRAEPVPATRQPEPVPAIAEETTPVELPEPEKSAATPKAPPNTAEPASKAPAEKSETGMWAVQLGSFSDQENAERLAADLRDQGFVAFLSQVRSGGAQMHRVRIGPQKDRNSAEAIAAQLTKSGLNGQVVTHP